MLMFADPVMEFPALPKGIDVDRDASKMRHVMEQLVAHLSGKIMPFRNRQAPRHRYAKIDMQAVANPPRSHVSHLCDAGNMVSSVGNGL